MTFPRRHLALGLAVPLLVTIVSCNKSPTSPEGGSRTGTFSSLTLTAPPEIAPGESAQLTAKVVRFDGSVDDVTSQAQWTVESSTSVLSLTETGHATAGERGIGVVTVRFAGLAAEGTILVLPRGTFRLSGRITADSVGVDGVKVTVVEGVGRGLTSNTDTSGHYDLFGVAGPVRIRAGRDGYLDDIEEIDVAAHRSLDFALRAMRPRDDYSGLYTLTVIAGGCAAGYPEAGKKRVYTARVQQTGASLQVFLSGADFRPRSDSFKGVVSGTGEITFNIEPLSPWDYHQFDFIEQLPGDTAFIVSGQIIARSAAAGIFGRGDATRSADGSEAFIWVNTNSAHWCHIANFDLVPR
jgi:hypothetical protein